MHPQSQSQLVSTILCHFLSLVRWATPTYWQIWNRSMVFPDKTESKGVHVEYINPPYSETDLWSIGVGVVYLYWQQLSTAFFSYLVLYTENIWDWTCELWHAKQMCFHWPTAPLVLSVDITPQSCLLFMAAKSKGARHLRKHCIISLSSHQIAISVPFLYPLWLGDDGCMKRSYYFFKGTLIE